MPESCHHIRLKLVATLLTLLLSLTSGTLGTPFNGLPLSASESLLILSLLIIIWTTRWYCFRLIRFLIPFSLLALLALQPIGHHYLPTGWSVCLHRLVALDHLTAPCEPSAQYRLGQTTYTLSSINWHDQFFPLHFMNDITSFNFHEPNEPDQQHLPYTTKAETYFRPTLDTPLTLTSSFPAQITINATIYPVTANRPVTISLPANQLTPVRLFYSSTNQPNQYIQVRTTAQPYLTLFVPASSWLLIYRSFTLFALFILLSSLVILFLNALFKTSPLSAFSILIVFIVYLLIPANPQLINLSYPFLVLSLSWLFITRPLSARSTFAPLFLFTLLLATHHFVSTNTPPLSFYIGTIGRDTWAHLSVARDQINWQTFGDFIGQNLFYYQPMHRYLLALPLKFLGESLWGAYLIQTYLASLAVTMTLSLLVRLNRPAPGLIFSALFLALNGFGLITYPWLSPFYITNTTYQQGMAVPLVILSSLLIYQLFLFPSRKIIRHVLIGLLLGLTLMTRMDYAPLLALIALYLLWLIHQPQKVQAAKLFLLLVVSLSIFPGLIILKNYLATGLVQLSPLSTTMNQFGGFYHIIPYAADPISATAMLAKIFHWYQGHYLDLVAVLYENLRVNFIGEVIYRQLLWFTTPILALAALRLGTPHQQALTSLLLLTFIPVVGLNLFFRLHPASFDMHIVFDYWLIVIASLGLAAIFHPPSQPTLS